MYALVNKFDQKTKNSDDRETVKKIVSSELMDGLIAESHVFPVSSFHGYLANHARHQLALHGKIDPNEPWVEDFARKAFGEFWEDRIHDPAEVKKGADLLWKKFRPSRPAGGSDRRRPPKRRQTGPAIDFPKTSGSG